MPHPQRFNARCPILPRMAATTFDSPEGQPVSIRDAHEDDYGAILRMNEADAEVFSPFDANALGRLAELADAFWAAETDGEVAARSPGSSSPCARDAGTGAATTGGSTPATAASSTSTA